MNIINRIIIWSSDNYNSLAMLRQVAQGCKNIDFIIHGKKGCTVKSKYIQKYIEMYSIENAYDYLMHNYINEDNKPIILTSGDNIIAFIDDHREKLSEYFIIPGTTKGWVRKYNDKYEMTCLAEKLGMVIPKSKYIKWNSSLNDILYPCIIKPSHQKTGMRNEFKFKKCQNSKQLAKILKFVHHDSVFIVQQFVEKEKDLLVYGSRMWDKNVIFAGALITDRFATGQGSSHGIVTPDIPSCIDVQKIIEYLNYIDYYGLFSFEYGLKNGKAYFFEVNLRNDGTSNFFYQSGANIPLAYIYSCLNINYKNINFKVVKEQYYIDEIFDYINVIEGNVSKQIWQAEYNNATAYKFYDSNDLVPYDYVRKFSRIKMYFDIVIQYFRIYILWIINSAKH